MAAATPHNPLLWRSMPRSDADGPMPDDLERVSANFAMIRETIAELDVDAVVLIGTDHIRQFFGDNSPAFIIGKAESYPLTWENEVRTFGMPYAEVRGHRELADVIGGRDVLPESIDFATSRDWRLDHGFGIPLMYLTPDLDIPIVPININGTLPPLPAASRFVALGEHIRDSVRAWDSPSRVALLTSGHMSTDIGGPRQFLGGDAVDPQFDRDAAQWMLDGDLAAAVEGSSYERVMAAGNMTYQYINVVTALAAMDGKPADFGEATASRFAASPFFLWRA
jgi:protocatechuate 4,5-dioxygenase beta chain